MTHERLPEREPDVVFAGSLWMTVASAFGVVAVILMLCLASSAFAQSQAPTVSDEAKQQISMIRAQDAAYDLAIRALQEKRDLLFVQHQRALSALAVPGYTLDPQKLIYAEDAKNGAPNPGTNSVPGNPGKPPSTPPNPGHGSKPGKPGK